VQVDFLIALVDTHAVTVTDFTSLRTVTQNASSKIPSKTAAASLGMKPACRGLEIWGAGSKENGSRLLVRGR